MYTAIVKQDNDWWVGWIEKGPDANCQERTHKELFSSLRVTVKEALEFNREDAIAAAGTQYTEERIAV